MDCRDVRESLSADIDGELSAGDSSAIAGHVAGCAACARKKRVLEDAWREVVRLDPEPASPCFDEAVWRQVGRRRSAAVWALAALVAAAALLGPALTREPVPAGGPPPRVAAGEVPDPGVGLDCGLPGARVCVAHGAVVVLAAPSGAFTAAH